MHSAFTDLLHGWHDFYLLVGTVSATLVGLMFVAASIGARLWNEQNTPALRAFTSPTVVHFSSPLFICALAIIPSQTARTLASLLAVAGLAGFAYSARIWVQLFVQRRFKVDLVDRLFYAQVPALGYMMVVASAVLLFLQHEWSLEALAAAILLLLATAMRNAWDLMTFIAIRTPTDGPPQQNSASAPARDEPPS